MQIRIYKFQILVTGNEKVYTQKCLNEITELSHESTIVVVKIVFN